MFWGWGVALQRAAARGPSRALAGQAACQQRPCPAPPPAPHDAPGAVRGGLTAVPSTGKMALPQSHTFLGGLVLIQVLFMCREALQVKRDT